MNKEEFLKAIMELPKIETNNPISAMNGINVDDLMNAIDRLNKVPDYNDLLKENQELKEKLLVTQTNEETFRLEMEDITKILGLDESTIFDDVKSYARNLKDNMFEKEQLNSLVNSCQEEIRQLKKQLEEKDILIKRCDLSVSKVMDCYCNRTDCSGRIKNSRKYDSLYQKYNKQLDNWNKLKEFMKKEYDYLDKYSTPAYGCAMGEINRIKNKMQELEGSDSNE